MSTAWGKEGAWSRRSRSRAAAPVPLWGCAPRGCQPVPPVGFRRSCVIAAVRHAPPRYLLLLCLVSHRCKWFSGKCHRNRSRARLDTTVGFLPGFGHRLLASHNQMSSEIPPAWPCARSQDGNFHFSETAWARYLPVSGWQPLSLKNPVFSRCESWAVSVKEAAWAVVLSPARRLCHCCAQRCQKGDF